MPLSLNSFEAASWFFPAVAFFFGACFAGVAGLIAHRLPHQYGWREDADPGLTIWDPPSRCDGCSCRLSALQLIPIVGWLAHRGRCPVCDCRVSVAYPLTEAATAVASGAVAAAFGPTPPGIALLAILWIFVVLSWLDLRDHWIPTAITAPLMLLGLLFSPFDADPLSRIWGATVGWSMVTAVFWFVGRLSGQDTYSGGDVDLARAVGAWAGLAGTVPFLVLSSVFFIVHAAPRRARGELWTPMGPALCAAAFVIFCLLAAGIVPPGGVPSLALPWTGA